MSKGPMDRTVEPQPGNCQAVTNDQRQNGTGWACPFKATRVYHDVPVCGIHYNSLAREGGGPVDRT
jgi:hypothetical protein